MSTALVSWGTRTVGDSCADIDNDGDPDLFVTTVRKGNHLFLNTGGGRFRDVTAAAGLGYVGHSSGAVFFDADNDGFADLYLVNMQGDDRLWENRNGREFVERTAVYFPKTPWGAMGVKFFDCNRDGRFEEISDTVGAKTYWPWGVSVGDLNADGFEDVFVTAGMGYPFRYGINSLLLNDQGRRFFDAEFLLGIEPRAGGRTEKIWFTLDCGGADRDHPGCAGFGGTTNVLGTLSSRSSALADLDGDGDLDLVTNDFHDAPQLLFSDLTERQAIRYLSVELSGKRSNRDGLGAEVTVVAQGIPRIQRLDGKSGYLAQSSLPLYFGLGDAETLEEVRVRWPSGLRQVIAGPIAPNRRLRLEEPNGK